MVLDVTVPVMAVAVARRHGEIMEGRGGLYLQVLVCDPLPFSTLR